MLGLICVEGQVAVVVLFGMLTVNVAELSTVECLVMFLMHGFFNNEMDWLSVMIVVMIETAIFSCLSNLESVMAFRFIA